MNTNQPFARRNKFACVVSISAVSLFASMASASDPLAGTLLHDFQDGREGFNPNAGLLLDSSGVFYGSTSLAGNGGGAGTVFSITPSGTFSNLHGFTGTDGNQVVSTLAKGTDGNFYGVTAGGGASGLGTVYRITPAGTVTTLHSFAGQDGQTPVGALVLASDGFLYGTTVLGGASGLGSVFRISQTGTFTTLFSFDTAHGTQPSGALVQASDGNLYGTTRVDGANGAGTVYRLNPITGSVTTFYDFDLFNGRGPYAGLTIGRDGNFYGVTETDGPQGYGVAFQLNTAGVYKLLHRFNLTDGSYPRGALIEGIDGALYGTTQSGGTYGVGTAFKVTPAGVFTSLINFSRPVGVNPLSEMTIGPDGGFYGTTVNGGRESGSVYKLLPKYTFKVDSEYGVPFNLLEHPIAKVRGKTYTEIKVCLTNPSSKTVTVPFTLTNTSKNPLEYDILTPADKNLVFQPGSTEQSIWIKTKLPPSYLQCDTKYVFTLGPSSNAAPGDIIVNTLTVKAENPVTPEVCKLLGY